MPKAKKQNNSDKMLTLFQNKTFTILFFLAIFTLFGGMFYLLQSSAAKVKPTVVIALTGCQATARGVPGDTFEFGAYATNKGGSDTVTIPNTGTVTGDIGGAAGMTAYGKIINAKGRVVASAEKAIPANCF